MTAPLADVELDALAGVVRHGLSRLDEMRAVHSVASYADLLRRHAARAESAIRSGSVEAVVRSLAIGTAEDLAQGLAALAMRPGGLRLFEVVFCAKHYPAGTEARTRYACPRCDPGARRDLTCGLDPRNVITIEGTL